MSTPYREAPASEKKPLPRMTFAYAPQGRFERGAAGTAVLVTLAPPTVAYVAVSRISESVPVAMVAAAATLILTVWILRRAKKRGVVLSVEDGTLRVDERFTTALSSLRDVVLETKTVERAMEGSTAQIGLGFGNMQERIAPPTDENRIVLETEKGSFPLTKTFFGHAETVEWFSKIRVFLRKAGWEPQSERVEEEEEEDDDDD